MCDYPVTGRNRIKRSPKRARYDRETVFAILDEGLICHVGLVEKGRAIVIPTLYARMGDRILLHGSNGSRLMKHISLGNEVCITVTLVDALVLARSVFHHSANYRSVVLYGTGSAIEDEAQRLHAMEALTQHIVPGRWEDARKPNAQELAATTVVAITIESASAKIRTGPPADDEEDYDLPIWAGLLPLPPAPQAPIPDPRLIEELSPPRYVTAYSRGAAG
ncbi:MAG TPA: pyridoxamine 5'-phosphate oxidase family protein [Chthonomonadales bacterium]|nr:pyridoxamine 5'-phosphate oxidase family protein [Chthonomonadales bacterium]